MEQSLLLTTYFSDWVGTYKRDAVRAVTLRKYETTLKRLSEIVPGVTLTTLDRRTYQGILNTYAQTHERQTTLDFHHQLRAAILDAVDDGLLKQDPTRRAVAKGTIQRRHATKYLSLSQTANLLTALDLSGETSWDHFIYLLVKTGLRFAEALALTPGDVDIAKRTVTVSKTWDYKSATPRFAPAKNQSSMRTLSLDKKSARVLARITQQVPAAQTIFVTPGKRVFNDTVNRHLRQRCTSVGIPQITLHGLRHTHASILLYAGVSVASVARRLGHANMTTTQKTYLHIIQELEAQDNEKIIRCLGNLS
ncbi:MAG: site-specific integrase [Propionibacteriaceae bacterium]|jgi:integrase|nr:site-specific integrase [Propionibacteriaceae bacterium]